MDILRPLAALTRPAGIARMRSGVVAVLAAVALLASCAAPPAKPGEPPPDPGAPVLGSVLPVTAAGLTLWSSIDELVDADEPTLAQVEQVLEDVDLVLTVMPFAPDAATHARAFVAQVRAWIVAGWTVKTIVEGAKGDLRKIARAMVKAEAERLRAEREASTP